MHTGKAPRECVARPCPTTRSHCARQAVFICQQVQPEHGLDVTGTGRAPARLGLALKEKTVQAAERKPSNVDQARAHQAAEQALLASGRLCLPDKTWATPPTGHPCRAACPRSCALWSMCLATTADVGVCVGWEVASSNAKKRLCECCLTRLYGPRQKILKSQMRHSHRPHRFAQGVCDLLMGKRPPYRKQGVLPTAQVSPSACTRLSNSTFFALAALALHPEATCVHSRCRVKIPAIAPGCTPVLRSTPANLNRLMPAEEELWPPCDCAAMRAWLLTFGAPCQRSLRS